METVFLILAKTAELCVSAVVLIMAARMILPIFVDVEDSRIYLFTCVVTEPIVAPVRMLMVKLNIGQDSPIDWSFFVTYMLLWLIRTVLPAV